MCAKGCVGAPGCGAADACGRQCQFFSSTGADALRSLVFRGGRAAPEACSVVHPQTRERLQAYGLSYEQARSGLGVPACQTVLEIVAKRSARELAWLYFLMMPASSSGRR